MATSTPFTNATVAQRELEVLSVVFTRADEQDYDTELSDSCLSNGDLLKCALVNRAWCNEVMSVLGHLPYEPFNLILEDISGNEREREPAEMAASGNDATLVPSDITRSTEPLSRVKTCQPDNLNRT
ncbi:unnamed protein product [Penicillium bialowiezense]